MNLKPVNRWILPATLLVLFIPSLITCIWCYPLIGPDEPRYASVAREMLSRGEWITPTLGAKPWFEKPVLLYWLIASSYKLLGVSELATRLGSVLAAIATVMFAYWTGAALHSKIVGFIAALMLMTSLLFFTFARGATFDILLTACVTAALAFFARAELREGASARRYVLLCAAAAGLAVLAKGLVGVVLLGGTVSAYAVMQGRVRKLLQYPLLPALAVFLAVSSVWYAPVIAVHGKLFLREFFLEHQFERLTTNRFHHPGPLYYYLAVSSVGFFPWTPFLLLLVARLKDFPKLKWRQGEASPAVFCACWVMVPLLFFTFSVSKLPGYFLPAMPGLALLTAFELWRKYQEDRSKLLFIAAALTLLLLAATGVWFAFENRIGISPLQHKQLSSSLFLLAAVGAVYLRKKNWRALLYALSVGVPLVIGLAGAAAAPWLSETLSYRQLAQDVARNVMAGEPVVYLGDQPREVHTLSFYADHGLYYDEVRGGIARSELRTMLSASMPSALVIVRRSNLDLLTSSRRLVAEQLAEQRDLRLMRVRLTPDRAPAR